MVPQCNPSSLRAAVLAFVAKPDDVELLRALNREVNACVWSYLVGCARRMGPWFNAHDEIGDIVHDTLCGVFRKAERLCKSAQLDLTREPEAIAAYFRTIAKNKLIDQIKRFNQRAKRWPLSLLVDVPAPDEPNVGIPPEVEAVLSQLSEADHAVIHLRLWQDLSYEELGQVLGTSARAAKQRFYRAIRRLRDNLAKDQ